MALHGVHVSGIILVAYYLVYLQFSYNYSSHSWYCYGIINEGFSFSIIVFVNFNSSMLAGVPVHLAG